MYRVPANYLTVRTCSTYHASDGTIHNVTAGYYHGSYNPITIDYDVAVLQVCTEFNLWEPCVLYIGRANHYPPNTPFSIFFQQIYVLNFLNMHTLRFFLFKMPLIS